MHVDPTEAVCAGPADPALIPYEAAAVVPVPVIFGEKQTAHLLLVLLMQMS